MVKLQKREYTEQALVDKICTEAQKRSYAENNRFRGGKQRADFRKKLDSYCEYEFDEATRKYTITDIFDVPKTKTQEKLTKGIYNYIAPLILDCVINSYDTGKPIQTTTMDIGSQIGMVNENYNCMKLNYEKFQNSLDISYYTFNEYFNKIDCQMNDYIGRCLKYLLDEGYVEITDIHLIKTFEIESSIINSNGDLMVTKYGHKRVATDSEVQLYNDVVAKAEKDTGAFTNYDKHYGERSKKYYQRVRDILAKHQIDCVYKGIEIKCANFQKCTMMLDSYKSKLSLAQSGDELRKMFKSIVDNNTAERVVRKRISDAKYAEDFLKLTTLTISSGAEDVRGIADEWETKVMRFNRRADTIRVTYREMQRESV